MALWPLPTAKRVPEAQDPPICMPTPNRKAPTSRLVPTGETDPSISVPRKPVPAASSGANSRQATASMSMCACSARPWPTATSWRQALVKPNRELNRATPRPRPTTKSSVSFRPAVAATAAASTTASTRPTSEGDPLDGWSRGRRRRGAALGAEGVGDAGQQGHVFSWLVGRVGWPHGWPAAVEMGETR